MSTVTRALYRAVSKNDGRPNKLFAYFYWYFLV